MESQFLNRAIELALSNVVERRGGPFGAVIVKDGAIVGEGANAVTSRLDPTAHAEVMAIRAACQKLGRYQLPGCVVYTSCEPCPMCLGAIYWAHIERVYFAATQHEAAQHEFDDALIYQELAIPHEKRRIPAIHVPLGEPGLAPFREWLKQEDRIRY